MFAMHWSAWKSGSYCDGDSSDTDAMDVRDVEAGILGGAGVVELGSAGLAAGDCGTLDGASYGTKTILGNGASARSGAGDTATSISFTWGIATGDG